VDWSVILFLFNFLLLLFFYRLSFSKQASNDLLRRMFLSAFFFAEQIFIFCHVNTPETGFLSGQSCFCS